MTKAQTIIAALEAAIANASPVKGVEWQIEQQRNAVLLHAIYSEDLEYTDEPWTALGEVPEFDQSLVDNDGHGTVFNFIQYDLDDEEA